MVVYKSTGATQILIVERDADGATRVARAVRDETNPRQWRTTLEHPSGNRPCSHVYGSKADAALALTHYLAETQIDWQQEKARGGRPVPGYRDTNVRVDELGQNIGPSIQRTR